MPCFKKKLSPHGNCSTSETCCWGLDWLGQRLAAFAGPGETTPSQDRTEGGRNTFNSRHHFHKLLTLLSETPPSRSEQRNPLKAFSPWPWVQGLFDVPSGEARDIVAGMSNTSKPGGCSKRAACPCSCDQMVPRFTQRHRRDGNRLSGKGRLRQCQEPAAPQRPHRDGMRPRLF